MKNKETSTLLDTKNETEFYFQKEDVAKRIHQEFLRVDAPIINLESGQPVITIDENISNTTDKERLFIAWGFAAGAILSAVVAQVMVHYGVHINITPFDIWDNTGDIITLHNPASPDRIYYALPIVFAIQSCMYFKNYFARRKIKKNLGVAHLFD